MKVTPHQVTPAAQESFRVLELRVKKQPRRSSGESCRR
jgi:hypothetical protein